MLEIPRVIEKGGRYMLEIKRLPNEDENRYIYRVCKQKDLIGTWEDVADLLNAELGHDYGESAYRKKFNYFERMFDSNLDDLIGDESADKVRELKDELRTERYKLQALNLSKTREMRQNSRFELFYEQIVDNVNRIKPEPMDIGYPKDWHPKTGGKGYVLALADIHYGANFKVATNEYSRAEAEARIKKLLKMMAEYLAEKDFPDLTVIGLGDTVQGILRYTDLKINEAPVVKCVVEVGYLIARFLDGLSKIVNVTYYHVPTANHTQTRPLGSKASEIATEDLESIVFAIIEEALRDNPKVKCYTDDMSDRVGFSICGFFCAAMHGHTIKTPAAALSMLMAKDRIAYDYLFIGHYHRGEEIPCGEDGGHNTEVLTCPSIVGTDPYADSLFVGSKAAAKVFEFDEEHGHIGDRLFILN